MKLSKNVKHFPDDEIKRMIDYSLVRCSLLLLARDYLMLPLYAVCLISPFHWKLVVWDLVLRPKCQLKYESVKEVTKHDTIRFLLILLIFKKTLHSIWHNVILFPINLVSLYYVPLFIHLVWKSDLLKRDPNQVLDKSVVPNYVIESVKTFQIEDFAIDYYYPSGVRKGIMVVNKLYL